MSEVIRAIDDGLKQVKSGLDARIDEIQEQVSDMAGRRDMGIMAGKNTKSMGALVAKSGELQSLIEGKSTRVRVPLNMSLKNLMGNTGTVDSNGSPFNVQPNRVSMYGEDARRRIQLIDELPRMAVGVNTIEFQQLDSWVSASDYQTEEGGIKPQQRTDIDISTVSVATIASYQRISEQLAADAENLMQFLDSKMRFATLDKFEAEVIGGAGGSGQINGLENQATAFGPTSLYSADRIAEAIARLDVLGWDATHVLMHPNDWRSIRTERATDGQYIAGSWATQLAPSIFGLPVVTSSSVTEGSALVVDAGQLMLCDRQSPTVEIGRVDDDFVRNILVVRCELRAALMVYSPSSVLQFDLNRS